MEYVAILLILGNIFAFNSIQDRIKSIDKEINFMSNRVDLLNHNMKLIGEDTLVVSVKRYEEHDWAYGIKPPKESIVLDLVEIKQAAENLKNTTEKVIATNKELLSYRKNSKKDIEELIKYLNEKYGIKINNENPFLEKKK